MIDKAKLIRDLRDARERAQQAIEGMEDNGTCNFDGIFFPTGKDFQIKQASSSVKGALVSAGCHAFHKSYGIRRGYVVSVSLGGQGSTRTKAAEVVQEHLEAAGWEVGMWYQVD